MVNSISKTVQSLVDNDLSLQDSLKKDYANYSAIARMLRPKVKEILRRDIKLESIITAVKRVTTTYRRQPKEVTEVVAKTVINIRTDVAKISVEKANRNLDKIRKALANFSGEFFNVTEGLSAITLIFDQKLFNEIRSMFQDRDVLDQRQSLAAVTLHSPIELISTPGCAQLFYGTISRKYINIEETVSCFTDTIIVVKMKDVGQAFAALTDLIIESRRQLRGTTKTSTNSLSEDPSSAHDGGQKAFRKY